MGEERKVHEVMVGKPEGKRPLGSLWRRWVNRIRMVLREIGWGCRVDPVGSGEGPVAGFVNTVMNLRVLAPQS
jgi:hypothetical protein